MVPHPLRNLVRAVAVEDLCPETLVSEFFLHLGKRLGGRFAQHRLGGDRVELLAHKVVLRRVADVEPDTEDLFLRLYELLRRGFGDGLEVEVLIL
jgi:hypothetical protein